VDLADHAGVADLEPGMAGFADDGERLHESRIEKQRFAAAK
jgi:hypothetical protein